MRTSSKKKSQQKRKTYHATFPSSTQRSFSEKYHSAFLSLDENTEWTNCVYEAGSRNGNYFTNQNHRPLMFWKLAPITTRCLEICCLFLECTREALSDTWIHFTMYQGIRTTLPNYSPLFQLSRFQSVQFLLTSLLKYSPLFTHATTLPFWALFDHFSAYIEFLISHFIHSRSLIWMKNLSRISPLVKGFYHTAILY